MNDDRRKQSRGKADRRRVTSRNVPVRAYAVAALFLLLLGVGFMWFVGV